MADDSPDTAQPRSRFANPPQLDGASLSPLALRLIACGLASQLLFVAVYLVEGVTRQGYDAWTHAISLLSLGPGGWVQQANFIILGLVTLVCGVPGWRLALAPGRGATAYPLLKVVEGMSLIAVGLFSQDPALGYPPGAATPSPSLRADIHLLFSVVAITTLAVSCLVLAGRFAAEPRWGRLWAAYSAVSGLLAIVFIAIFGAMSTHVALGGLFERLSLGAVTLLAVLVVGRLLVQARLADTAPGTGRRRRA